MGPIPYASIEIEDSPSYQHGSEMAGKYASSFIAVKDVLRDKL